MEARKSPRKARPLSTPGAGTTSRQNPYPPTPVVFTVLCGAQPADPAQHPQVEGGPGVLEGCGRRLALVSAPEGTLPCNSPVFFHVVDASFVPNRSRVNTSFAHILHTFSAPAQLREGPRPARERGSGVLGGGEKSCPEPRQPVGCFCPLSS